MVTRKKRQRGEGHARARKGLGAIFAFVGLMFLGYGLVENYNGYYGAAFVPLLVGIILLAKK